MQKKFLFQIALLIVSIKCLSQPYNGTIFVDSDIIISSDSSALQNVTYIGQGNKTIFDRRLNNWTTVNAYLFDVVWNDELSSEAVVNPEFATIELARVEAEKYGRIIGQLPYCLRLDVNEIWINKGVEPFGGGNNSILIHTGQTVLYENDGILEETLVHEASHTSLDAKHATSTGWLEAQDLDKAFISDYAKDNPNREDIAESFLMWMAVRYREHRISAEDFILIMTTIPNRLEYFDDVECDLHPFQFENTTSVNELYKEENDIIVYPNPTKEFIQLKLDNENIYQASIFNVLGDIVLNRYLSTTQKINLSEFSNGVYFLVLHKNGERIIKKIMKL